MPLPDVCRRGRGRGGERRAQTHPRQVNLKTQELLLKAASDILLLLCFGGVTGVQGRCRGWMMMGVRGREQVWGSVSGRAGCCSGKAGEDGGWGMSLSKE